MVVDHGWRQQERQLADHDDWHWAELSGDEDGMETWWVLSIIAGLIGMWVCVLG